MQKCVILCFHMNTSISWTWGLWSCTIDYGRAGEVGPANDTTQEAGVFYALSPVVMYSMLTKSSAWLQENTEEMEKTLAEQAVAVFRKQRSS